VYGQVQGGHSKREAAEVGEDRSSGGYAIATFKSERTKENPRGVWWDTVGGRWGGKARRLCLVGTVYGGTELLLLMGTVYS